jgi:hypothetical protein
MMTAPGREPWPDPRGRGAGRPGERGATVIELALLMPLVLAVVLLVVQAALWFHGRQVADAAAREGARLARVAGVSAGWKADAEARAVQLLRAVGPELLHDARVQAWEKGDQRGMEITGNAIRVVPLVPELAFTVTARFGGPIECFRPDDDSGGCR